jgi:hypothetical protein
MPFDVTGRLGSSIPFGLDDYIALAEWRGRLQRPDKRGSIRKDSTPVLDTLGLDEESFLAMSGQLLKTFGSAIGSSATMTEHCTRRDLKYLRGAAAVKSARD